MKRKLGRGRDPALLAHADPRVGDAVPERHGEGSEVRDHARGDEHVAGEVLVGDAELGGALLPALALAAQAADQRLGALEFYRAQVNLILQALLLVDGILELLLHRGEFAHDVREVILLLLERVHDLLVLSLGLGERELLRCDDFGDSVVRVHGEDPLAQTRSGSRRFFSLFDGVGFIRDVLGAELLHDHGVDVVLVVAAELIDERRVHEEFLGRGPVVLDHLAGTRRIGHLGGLDSQRHAHRLQHQLDHRRRALERVDVLDVLVRDGVQRGDGGFERGDGLGEQILALLFHRPRRLALLGRLGNLLIDGSLLRLDNLHLFALHLLHEFLRLRDRLDQVGLERRELVLHVPHGIRGEGELLQTNLVPPLCAGDGLSLLGQQRGEHVEQLEVGRGRDVVVPPLLGEVLLGELADPLVETLAHDEQLLALLGGDVHVG